MEPRIQVFETEKPSALCPEAEGGMQFHGRQKEHYVGDTHKTEMPWHFQAAKCIALGMTAKETGTFCDRSTDSITKLIRAPFFQARVIELMKETGTGIMEMFQGSAIAAHATLVEIQNDTKVSPSARIAAAKEILERGYGKSVTYIESKTQTISGDPHAREAELLSQVKALRATSVQDLVDDRDYKQLS